MEKNVSNNNGKNERRTKPNWWGDEREMRPWNNVKQKMNFINFPFFYFSFFSSICPYLPVWWWIFCVNAICLHSFSFWLNVVAGKRFFRNSSIVVEKKEENEKIPISFASIAQQYLAYFFIGASHRTGAHRYYIKACKVIQNVYKSRIIDTLLC